jgi:flagellar hook-basal body complex protein FliE
MAIAPIGAIAPANLGSLTNTAARNPAQGIGADFADLVSGALERLDASHAATDELAVKAATGDLDAVHDLTIAVTEAQLLTQLTVEVRNRAIEAFNDIMRMQV